MSDLAQFHKTLSEEEPFYPTDEIVKGIASDIPKDDRISLDKIEMSMAELQTDVDDSSRLARENARKDGEIKVLREQESNTQSEIKHLRQENESLKVDSALAKREAAENAKVKDDMSTKYYITKKEKNEIINKLKAELADVKAQMDAIRAKGYELQTKVDGLVKQNDQLAVEKQELEKRLAEAAQKIKSKKQSDPASSPTALKQLQPRAYKTIPPEVEAHFLCPRTHSSDPSKKGKCTYVSKEDPNVAFTNIKSCMDYLKERGIIKTEESPSKSSDSEGNKDDGKSSGTAETKKDEGQSSGTVVTKKTTDEALVEEATRVEVTA